STLALMPGRPAIRSVKRRGPSRSSRATSRVHRSPTTSRARATGQYWSYVRLIRPTYPGLVSQKYLLVFSNHEVIISNHDTTTHAPHRRRPRPRTPDCVGVHGLRIHLRPRRRGKPRRLA